MMIRTKFLILLAFAICSSVVGLAQTNSAEILPNDKLTIELVGIRANNSSDYIYVDGIKMAEGDTFTAKQKISWPSNVDYIRVMNRRTYRSETIYSDKFEREKVPFYSIYLKNPRTITKGAGLSTEAVQDMRDWLSQTFYMFDDGVLYISSSLIIDNAHTFLLEPTNRPNATSFELWVSPKFPYLIYITKEMLETNNIDIEREPCTFRVKYIRSGERTIYITENFTIEKHNN